jgi:hypothetical protein
VTEYTHFTVSLYGDDRVSAESERMIALIRAFVDERKESVWLWRRLISTDRSSNGESAVKFRFNISPVVPDNIINDFSAKAEGIKKELSIYNIATDMQVNNNQCIMTFP